MRIMAAMVVALGLACSDGDNTPSQGSGSAGETQMLVGSVGGYQRGSVAVVLLEPRDGAAPPPASTALMDQYAVTFIPGSASTWLWMLRIW